MMIRKVTGTVENYTAFTTDSSGYNSMSSLVVRTEHGQERLRMVYMGDLLKEFWAAKVQAGEPVVLYISTYSGQKYLLAIEAAGESLYDPGIIYNARDGLEELMSSTKQLMFISVFLMVVLIGFVTAPLFAYYLYRQKSYYKALDEPVARREVAALSQGPIKGLTN